MGTTGRVVLGLIVAILILVAGVVLRFMQSPYYKLVMLIGTATFILVFPMLLVRMFKKSSSE